MPAGKDFAPCRTGRGLAASRHFFGDAHFPVRHSAAGAEAPPCHQATQLNNEVSTLSGDLTTYGQARRPRCSRECRRGKVSENNMDNSKQRLVLPRTTMRGYENAVRLRGERRMLSLQVVSVVTNRTYRRRERATETLPLPETSPTTTFPPFLALAPNIRALKSVLSCASVSLRLNHTERR